MIMDGQTIDHYLQHEYLSSRLVDVKATMSVQSAQVVDDVICLTVCCRHLPNHQFSYNL